MAATHAAKEVIWLKHFLSEVFRPINKPITLYRDSQSAIALTQDGSHHTRTKHIDIQDGKIKIVYCPTDEMVADILTKPLPSLKAKHFARALGLASP